MTEASMTEQTAPYFPPERENPFDPAEVYRSARRASGLTRMNLGWQGRDVTVISRYADVKAVLSSDDVSTDLTLPNFPVMAPHRRFRGTHPVTFLHQDPPAHTGLRRLVMPELSVKKARAMRPTIQRIVDDALDSFESSGNPGELMLDYAFNIPGSVVCALFGVPLEDAPQLIEWSRGILHPGEDGEIDLEARVAFAGYLGRHLESDTDAPIVARLREARAAGTLDSAEMLMVAYTVFAGGFESTASMIGATVFEVLRRPGVADYIREADESQLALAVDELFRYLTVAHYGIGRVAKADIPLSQDVTVPGGEHLIVSLASANRDETVFENADELDLERRDNPHVAFGFGPHQCPGQHLARAEVQIAVQSLVRRLPNLRLVEAPEDVQFRESAEIRGPIELHVAW